MIRKAFVLCTRQKQMNNVLWIKQKSINIVLLARQYANMLRKKPDENLALFFHRNVFIARREVLTIL